MGYKEILVTVDTGPAGSARLDLAAALAERFEAHLIGLHTALTPLAPRAGGYFDRFDRSLLDPIYREFSEGMIAREQAAQSLFEEVAREAAARGRVAQFRRLSVRGRCAARALCRSGHPGSDRP